MKELQNVTTDSIGQCKDRALIRITARLSQVSIKHTRTAGDMAIAMLGGAPEPVDIIIFPDAYRAAREIIVENSLVTIEGQIEDSRPEITLKLMVERISPAPEK